MTLLSSPPSYNQKIISFWPPPPPPPPSQMDKLTLRRSISNFRRTLLRPRPTRPTALASSSSGVPKPQELRFLSGSSTLFRRSPVTAPFIHPRRNLSFSTVAVSTSPREAPRDTDSYAVAERLGFQKISEQVIDECKSTAVLYKHKKTGAEIMSVSKDNENKAFGVVFRTPPKDSTGVPHILEHSVLC